jgi:hypothetical protein
MAAALKYILVPEPNFKSLLTETTKTTMPQTGKGISDDLEEKTLFEFVKKKLSQAKKGKKKNASTKNVLFNQRLRSYLKARKALLNRPMKVQLDSIGKELISKGGEKAILDENGELEPIQRQPSVRTPRESVDVYRTAGSTADWSGADDTVFDHTPTTTQQLETPIIKTRRQQRLEKSEGEKKEKQQRLNALSKLIASNPSKFGVLRDEEGKYAIMNPQTKRPVFNSSIVVALNRLINPTPDLASPPGMIYLRRKILEDPEASQLIHQSSKQSGKGWLRQRKHKKVRGKKHRFQPMRWKKIQKRRK